MDQTTLKATAGYTRSTRDLIVDLGPENVDDVRVNGMRILHVYSRLRWFGAASVLLHEHHGDGPKKTSSPAKLAKYQAQYPVRLNTVLSVSSGLCVAHNSVRVGDCFESRPSTKQSRWVLPVSH